MSDAPEQGDAVAHRVALLSGQALALGLLMAWIVIPASTIFLSAYGAELLPVTYLGAALAGVGASATLTAALRTRPLVAVALRVLVAMVAVLVAAWAMLRGGATWVSFGVLVLVPIVVPVGFMLLVGQAGMLLDVRALKALYARVIAGFALGFVVGGLAAPPLLDVAGATEDLLLAAATAGGLWIVLLRLTRRRFPAELGRVEHVASAVDDAPSWGTLLRDRYVTLIVAFQMLSAVESQWLDYLVYDRAARRYEDAQELATFISRFLAISYGADILFLLLIAGALLRRFGLRYGLTANPAAVLALVAGIIGLSTLQGGGATIVFVLVVAARVTDLVLADGAARTSLSAAYQVVPTRLRLAAQAGVEGLAVPLAIGASGLVLLVLQATTGTGGLLLPVLVVAVVSVWLVVALLVHRSYRANLLTSLRFRTLDPAALSLEDANLLAAADGLLASDDDRDVVLGVELLVQAEHPALVAHLQRLTEDGNRAVRADALWRLGALDASVGAEVARRHLDDPDPAMRATSLRVLAAVGTPADGAVVERCRRDDAPEVRAAALVAAARLGDEPTRGRVSAEVARLALGPGDDRRLVAQVFALGGSGLPIDRTPLCALIVDADPVVANAALAAARFPEDLSLVPSIVIALAPSATASAAADALVRSGSPALALVTDRLGDPTDDPRSQHLLVRIARDVGGSEAVEVLARFAQLPDRDLGLAVLRALGALVSSAADEGWDPPAVDASLAVLADVEHATHVLRAICTCRPHRSAQVVEGALRDELALLQRRVLAGLAIHHGEEAIARVTFQLAKGDRRAHALAVEWLEVTLIGTDRTAIALLEPGLSDEVRLRRLARAFPLPDIGLAALLEELARGTDGRWRRPWLQACALHAAWSVGVDLPPLERSLAGPPTGIVAETHLALAARAGSD